MGIGTSNPDYKLHIEDYKPQIALKSTNDSHQEGCCRSEILFKDHDNYCLSKIVGQHESTGNDSKGCLLFYTNPNLSHSLGLGMKIDNNKMVHIYGNVNISGSVNIKDSLKIEKGLSVGGNSALGFGAVASGSGSTAMGESTTATGNNSIAMGYKTVANGGYSIAMGYESFANANHSIAIGYKSLANRSHSIAMGYKTVANGAYSLALGKQTRSTGNNSTALGIYTTASGLGSTAMGKETIASGFYSTSMGKETTASGNQSTAMGHSTTASGNYSTAMGALTTALGHFSTAMGSYTTASGSTSASMGVYTTASGDYSTAMGIYTRAGSFSETSIGSFNNDVSGNSSDWFETDRLFVIGNGTNTDVRSDALVMLKNADTTFSGNINIEKGLNVSGSTNLNGSLSVAGRANFKSDLRICGSVNIIGSLNVRSRITTKNIQCSSITKGSGNFKIDHPVPEKKDTHWLYHSFVESPTAGDNIYRYEIETKNLEYVIYLEEYHKYLNTNYQVWVNPAWIEMPWGRGIGYVKDNKVFIKVDIDGKYNILVISTRMDSCATNNWKGVEVKK